MASSERAIAILGMHRSGTSMISRSLNLLGVDLGGEEKLVKAATFNPKGFWEHQKITKTEQQLLKELARSWDSEGPLPNRWLEKRKVKDYKEQLKTIVTQDFKGKKLWGWKDPRSCLLLPLWQQLLAELQIDLSYAIIVRHPLDVAASLRARNQFDTRQSLNIWTLYTLSALLSSEQGNRIVLNYDQFMREGERELKRVSEVLEIPWPQDDLRLREEIDSFIQPDLQHSKSSVQDLYQREDVPEFVRETYELVLKAEQSTEFLATQSCSTQVRKLYDRYLESLEKKI